MLQFCANTLLRCQSLKQTYRILSLQNYATISVKDVFNETSDETGTLVTRFAKHVALERQKICELVPTKVRYPDYFPIREVSYFKEELKKTDKDQIATVIIYAFTYRSNADPAKFAIILNELDRYAVNNIEKMNPDTILRTLYAFLFLMPNWMTRLDFYYRAMQLLCGEANQQEIKSKEHLVQLCFYLGLTKKQTYHNNLLNSLLHNKLGQHIAEMNTLDMALISNAAYKTSTVIKNEDFNQRLLKEVLDISDLSNGNDALLVNFVKSMRLQRFNSSEVCEYIENIFKNAKKREQLEIRGQVHLFAYLAENLWDCNHCTLPLILSIIEQITHRFSGSQPIRVKDISTFLWSCAQLSCSLSSVHLLNVEKALLKRLSDGEFISFPDQLVDCCLSLWILGHKSKDLLQASVKYKYERDTNPKQPKKENRLTVLLSAAKIEEPAWCTTMAKGFKAFDLKMKMPSHLLNNQDTPYQKIIDELLKEDNVSTANLSCPVNGINIPGIHVILSTSTENQVFLEFMTPKQTLHFSQEPAAILRLKLRLLQFLGYKAKLVSSDILNSQNIKNALNDEDDVQEENIQEPSKTSIKA